MKTVNRPLSAALLVAVAAGLALAQDAPPAAPADAPAALPAGRAEAHAPGGTMAEHPVLAGLDPAARTLGEVPRPDAAQRRKFDALIGGIADPQNTLDLVVGLPRLLQLKRPPMRVQVPDDKIVSYDVLTDGELSVAGKATGTTVLNLWFADPVNPAAPPTLLSYLVRVFPDPQAPLRLARVYDAIQGQINAAFPDAKVTLTMIGENLLVRGECKTNNDVTQILRILAASVPNGIAAIPADDPGANGSVGASAVGTPGLRGYLGGGNSSTINIGGANNTGAGRNGRAATGGPRIINLLRVPGESQVSLKVTVAEVNRSAARSIGLNFGVVAPSGRQIFSDYTGNLGSIQGSLLVTGGNLPMILGRGQVGIALQALRTLSLAKSLAEPNLVAVDGQTASFQAGGQFPVPIVTGATSVGLQGVEYIPFGVQVSFTPYITDRDRIRLVLAGDVSTRDASIGSTVNGADVAGVDTRNFQTTVDLKPGQSLAIAGLIQQNYGANANRIPFFGDLPILSSLLGNNQTSAAEQELVVLVTADLVTPLEAKDVPPLPGSDIFEPGDVEFFLGGRLESAHRREFRSPLGTDFDRLARLEHLQQVYVAGPSGYADEPAAYDAADPSSKVRH